MIFVPIAVPVSISMIVRPMKYVPMANVKLLQPVRTTKVVQRRITASKVNASVIPAVIAIMIVPQRKAASMMFAHEMVIVRSQGIVLPTSFAQKELVIIIPPVHKTLTAYKAKPASTERAHVLANA